MPRPWPYPESGMPPRNPDPRPAPHLEDPRDVMKGHPTSPGPHDAYEAREGLPSPGNGVPGVPRVWPTPRPGPGIPGHTPTGPFQPGTEYDGPEEEGFA